MDTGNGKGLRFQSLVIIRKIRQRPEFMKCPADVRAALQDALFLGTACCQQKYYSSQKSPYQNRPNVQTGNISAHIGFILWDSIVKSDQNRFRAKVLNRISATLAMLFLRISEIRGRLAQLSKNIIFLDLTCQDICGQIMDVQYLNTNGNLN